MQRLIEQAVDDGEVLDRGSFVGRVHYHLSVYQHFSELEGESVPAALEVEGLIVPHDGTDLSDLQRERELTLRLADGRFLDFSIITESGAIRSTGRGLFRE